MTSKSVIKCYQCNKNLNIFHLFIYLFCRIIQNRIRIQKKLFSAEICAVNVGKKIKDVISNCLSISTNPIKDIFKFLKHFVVNV